MPKNVFQDNNKVNTIFPHYSKFVESTDDQIHWWRVDFPGLQMCKVFLCHDVIMFCYSYVFDELTTLHDGNHLIRAYQRFNTSELFTPRYSRGQSCYRCCFTPTLFISRIYDRILTWQKLRWCVLFERQAKLTSELCALKMSRWHYRSYHVKVGDVVAIKKRSILTRPKMTAMFRSHDHVMEHVLRLIWT